MNRIFLVLATLVTIVFTGCGKDGCDPTGQFGCQQYTSHTSVDITNQTDLPLAVEYEPCECCSKGRSKWSVDADAKLVQQLTIVDEGGGDACDESAEYHHLSVHSAKVVCNLEFYAQTAIVGTCDENGCDFGKLGKCEQKPARAH